MKHGLCNDYRLIALFSISLLAFLQTPYKLGICAVSTQCISTGPHSFRTMPWLSRQDVLISKVSNFTVYWTSIAQKK